MASAYGIVKNHGGIITVASNPGQGAEFDIYLPASNKAVPTDKAVKHRTVQGTETILLVDDEDMIINVGKAMLEKLGYHVVTAKGGRQALDTLRHSGNGIDLVVLDLIMPGMDGGTVFDRIREIRPDLPVLLSSGYAIDGQAGEIMGRGCNGFIQKLFTLAEISLKLREILDEAPPRSSNDRPITV